MQKKRIKKGLRANHVPSDIYCEEYWKYKEEAHGPSDAFLWISDVFLHISYELTRPALFLNVWIIKVWWIVNERGRAKAIIVVVEIELLLMIIINARFDVINGISWYFKLVRGIKEKSI